MHSLSKDMVCCQIVLSVPFYHICLALFSLLLRFTDDTFDPDQGATIGVDFKVKNFTIDDKRVKLSLWVSPDMVICSYDVLFS